MKNIHLFESKDAYDAAKKGLILPTVSYIKENKDVKYNPFNANGHEFVVIAGIKWATMNVGANDVTDYGLYFQWGDTSGYTANQVGTGEGKKKFARDWSDYKWYDKENTTSNTPLFTKYNETGMTLDLEDDAVHAVWGGSWRMPTSEEMQTVLDSTAVTKTWKTGYNGTSVAGYEFHDNNSNDTLFFPACGFAIGGSVRYVGSVGYYWLSSLNTGNVSYADELYFNSDDDDADVDASSDYRYNGRCVRGVLAEN